MWPGDTEFSFELSQTKEKSGSVNVGRITMSAHTGTHIDAPFHFDSEGWKVLDLDPSIYVGPARVIDLSGAESIGRSELSEHDLDGVSRLLVKTGSWTDRDEFTDMQEWFNEEGYEADIPALRNVYPQLSTLEQYLRDHGWQNA